MEFELTFDDEKIVRDITDNSYVTDNKIEKYCEQMVGEYITILKEYADDETSASFSETVTMTVKLPQLEEKSFDFEFNFSVNTSDSPATIGYSFLSVDRIDCNPADETTDDEMTSINDGELFTYIEDALLEIVVSFCGYLTNKLDAVKTAYEAGIKAALRADEPVGDNKQEKMQALYDKQKLLTKQFMSESFDLYNAFFDELRGNMASIDQLATEIGENTSRSHRKFNKTLSAKMDKFMSVYQKVFQTFSVLFFNRYYSNGTMQE